jgi:hypothetical protein
MEPEPEDETVAAPTVMVSAGIVARRAGEEGGEHGSDGAFVFYLRKGLHGTKLAASVREALVPSTRFRGCSTRS